jgi:tRNA (cytidine/uridine-2'-O-)-methyltransferase
LTLVQVIAATKTNGNTCQKPMRLALYQPDIPQNTGTILRMAACLAMPVDIIRPAGFDLSDRSLRRALMDYVTHDSWHAFRAVRGAGGGRLVALTTQAAVTYTDFAYQNSDTLLLGRESAGLPDDVHAACDARVKIPMAPGTRSLNVAVAAAMVTGEALRQVGGFSR